MGWKVTNIQPAQQTEAQQASASVPEQPKSKWRVSSIQPATAPEETKGLKGIGQDVLRGTVQGLKDIPSTTWQGLKALPGEAWGAYTQAFNDPIRALKNVGVGMADTGQKIHNLPSKGLQYLADKGLLTENTAKGLLPKGLQPTNIDLAKTFGVQGNQSGDQFIQGAAGYGPFGAAGEVGALGTLGRMGARSGAAGAYGAVQGQNPITAAGMVPAGEAMVGAPIHGAQAAGRGVNNMRPSSMLSGNSTNQELAQRLSAAKGTQSTLGDVVGSPGLSKAYHNVISPVFGSGSDKVYRNISDKVGERGEALLQQAESRDAELSRTDPNQYIKDLIGKAKQESQKRKNELYEQRDKVAEDEGFYPDLRNFRSLAKEKNMDINDSAIMKEVKGFGDLLNKTGGYAETGIRNPTLKEARTVRSDIYTKGKDLLKSSESSQRSLGKEYMDLYNALSSDLKDSVENKGSEKLKSISSQADQNFKEDFARFLDKDVQKQVDEGAKADAIAHAIIQPGKKRDLYSRIEKIQDLLPEKHKSAIGSAYLQGAIDQEGKLNVNDLYSRINSLGKRQFKALFPDEKLQSAITDFKRLKEMSNESINRLANPQTGQRAVSTITALSQALTAGMGIGAGHTVYGLLMASMPSVMSNLATKVMTSPKVRESMVNAIMKNQSKTAQKQKNVPELTLNKFAGYLPQGTVPLGVNQQQGGQ